MSNASLVGAVGPELVAKALGPFESLEPLGKGSFGVTFRAVRAGKTFAIKVIHHPALPTYLWDRELAALKAANHPNVVGFRGSGEFSANGAVYRYLECEFIGGGTVENRINSKIAPTSPQETTELLRGLLEGVAEIHDLGILHRDIKPANVGLRDSSFSQPVLFDFGLARVLDMSSHTDYPAQIGTIAYMAPEQLRGAPARRRSDLFGVAALVYHAGTGVHPFVTPDVADVMALLQKIEMRPPADPRTLTKVFDDQCAEVVMRLLSARAHERLSVERALEDLSK